MHTHVIRTMARGLALWLASACWAVGMAQSPSAQASAAMRMDGGACHWLVLQADGSLWSWGCNGSGQLGYGSVAPASEPTKVAAGPFVQVAAGIQHSLALDAQGALWAWGDNANGQLGLGHTRRMASPQRVGPGFSQVATTERNTLALKTDGTLWAWGRAGPVLGFTHTSDVLLPTQVGNGYATLATGNGHVLALKADGTLWAWGDNSRGQLATGGFTSAALPALVGSDYVQVGARSAQSFARKADQSLWNWGDVCQVMTTCPFLFSTTLGIVTRPVRVSGNFVDLAVRGGIAQTQAGTRVALGLTVPEISQLLPSTTLAQRDGLVLTTNGRFRMTGNLNADGQLGLGRSTVVDLPRLLGPNFAEAHTGASLFALGLRTDGTLTAWGQGNEGQLAQGTVTASTAALVVLTEVARTSAGDREAYAVQRDGTLWRWGANTITGFQALTPRQVGTGFSNIATAFDRSFGLKPDGSLWAWGRNSAGQLGDGTRIDAAAPVQIGQRFIQVAASNRATVGLQADGSVWVWTADPAALSSEAAASAGAPRTARRVSQRGLALGQSVEQLYAITQSTDLWTFDERTPWGDGDNLLGAVPAGGPLWLGGGFASVASGFFAGYAVRADGRLLQLPVATRASGTADTAPALFEVGDGFTQASAGNGFTLGVRRDGTLWGWGRDEAGVLLSVPAPPQATDVELVFDPANIANPIHGDFSAVGSIESLTLGASIRPLPEHTQGHIFFVAILADGRPFTHTPQGWQPLDAVQRQAHSSGQLKQTVATLLVELDARVLRGATLFMGYGLGSTANVSFDEMLASGRYKRGYVIQ